MGITDLIIIMATSNGIIIGYWHPYKIKINSPFIVDYRPFIWAPEYDNPKVDNPKADFNKILLTQ